MPDLNDGPNPQDLTTVGQAKDWIPGFKNNPTPDSTLQKLITGVSRDVVRMVGAMADRNPSSPTFGKNTLNAQIQFLLTLDGNGSDVLFPPVRPLHLITQLQVNGYAPPINVGYGQFGVAIENDGYSIAFNSTGFGSGQSITVGWPGRGPSGRFPMGRRNVLLGVIAGYGVPIIAAGSPPTATGEFTTPDDLEVAVLQTIALNYVRRDHIDIDSENISAAGVSTSYSKYQYPPNALAVLNKYVRVPLGSQA
jgi:hypothetical protein